VRRRNYDDDEEDVMEIRTKGTTRKDEKTTTRKVETM
jgi:hypothetical protein